MQTIVVFNNGRDAGRSGLPRSAPDEIDYPVVSRYQPYHTVKAALSDWMKREWLRGYDHAASN